MSKTKNKDVKRTVNPHLQARIAYLRRASTYLATLPRSSNVEESALLAANVGESQVQTEPDCQRLSEGEMSSQSTREALTDKHDLQVHPIGRLLASNLRSVARKSQIRLSSDIKHSICKVCNAPMVNTKTASTTTENKSNGGRKAWAEVSCITCRSCGTVKRFPVGATRQLKMTVRHEASPAPS